MKIKTTAILLLFIFILAGCAGKNASNSSSSSKNASSINASKTGAATSKDAKNVKNVAVPKLSSSKKAEVNTKLGSAISDIKSSLQSLDDTDVDLNSLN